MKTYLTYGLGIAVAGAVLTLILFLLGFHSDLSKLKTAQVIALVGSIIIWIIGIALGTKARRAEVPADENFGYGRALGAGVMITLFGALFGAILSFAYIQLVNPELRGVLVEAQVQELEGRGLTAAQIEGAERVIHMMTHPAFQAASAFIGAILIGIVVSLIAAVVLKRPAGQVERELPPTLG